MRRMIVILWWWLWCNNDGDDNDDRPPTTKFLCDKQLQSHHVGHWFQVTACVLTPRSCAKLRLTVSWITSIQGCTNHDVYSNLSFLLKSTILWKAPTDWELKNSCSQYSTSTLQECIRETYCMYIYRWGGETGLDRHQHCFSLTRLSKLYISEFQHESSKISCGRRFAINFYVWVSQTNSA